MAASSPMNNGDQSSLAKLLSTIRNQQSSAEQGLNRTAANFRSISDFIAMNPCSTVAENLQRLQQTNSNEKYSIAGMISKQNCEQSSSVIKKNTSSSALC
jgi:hypothetical protein